MNGIKYTIIVSFLALLFSCNSQKLYTEMIWDYPEDEEEPKAKKETVVKPDAGDEKIVVREEKVKLTHGESLQKYSIILGSFSSDQNALNFRKTLMEKGFDRTVILRNEKGMYRVAALSFNEEAAARRELLSLRKSYSEYCDAWLLVTN